MKINESLNEVVNTVQNAVEDKFNPSSYFNSSYSGETGHYKAQYVLGNLYCVGKSYTTNMNFEIFKDHSGWQIWCWPFDSEKPEYNQLNTPYYNYNVVREYLNNL